MITCHKVNWCINKIWQLLGNTEHMLLCGHLHGLFLLLSKEAYQKQSVTFKARSHQECLGLCLNFSPLRPYKRHCHFSDCCYVILALYEDCVHAIDVSWDRVLRSQYGSCFERKIHVEYLLCESEWYQWYQFMTSCLGSQWTEVETGIPHIPDVKMLWILWCDGFFQWLLVVFS